MSEQENQYYARWGRMDPFDYVWFWAIILPPVKEIKESSEPVLNIAFRPDFDHRSHKTSSFTFARNSCRMIFHGGHEEQSSFCGYGRTGYEDHSKNSVQVVTRHLFAPVMQQMVDITESKRGKEEVLKNIEGSLFGEGFNSCTKKAEYDKWKAEDLMGVSEMQKSYLEKLGSGREFVEGIVETIGVEAGIEFFHPDEIPVYMEKKDLKVYEITGITQGKNSR